jgi:UDP-N-acetylglucosamine--dolichyl-phosphate N-acetylglucosaminephosphotransferase
MVALAIFSTNSINILAGVNGLEAGQTFVVACAILTHNLFSIASALEKGVPATYPSVADGHLFSTYLMLPLAGCTLALLVYNW